jgi:hypothetical protein
VYLLQDSRFVFSKTAPMCKVNITVFYSQERIKKLTKRRGGEEGHRCPCWVVAAGVEEEVDELVKDKCPPGL